MKTLPFFLFGMMCSLAFVSCSVKTERTLCPGLVSILAEGGEDEIMQVIAAGESSYYEGRISKSGGKAASCFEIERGPVLLSVLSGLHSCRISGTQVLIDEDTEMDRLYAFSDSVGVYSDIVEMSCVLHKQFAQLYLTIVETEDAAYPYYVKISGNVCGMDYADLSPVAGPFSATIHPIIGEYHRICLPRHSDDDTLELEFYDRDMTKAGEAPVDRLPLADYIRAAGYDWSKEDLEDIYVSVDYTDGGVSVSVKPWNKVEI